MLLDSSNSHFLLLFLYYLLICQLGLRKRRWSIGLGCRGLIDLIWGYNWLSLRNELNFRFLRLYSCWTSVAVKETYQACLVVILNLTSICCSFIYSTHVVVPSLTCHYLINDFLAGTIFQDPRFLLLKSTIIKIEKFTCNTSYLLFLSSCWCCWSVKSLYDFTIYLWESYATIKKWKL
jgi:hypothetical protein